jgi:uncharacterized protein
MAVNCEIEMIAMILQAMSVPNPNTLPVTTVDLNAFCDANKVLSGQSMADEFGALNDDVAGSLQAVDWRIQGSFKPVMGAQYDKNIAVNDRFLHVVAHTQASVTCGRCLKPMTLKLRVDTQLQVFQTDAAADAAAMQAEADTLPDPIVASRTFDLLDQVQEELLLAMPDNAMHDETDPVCSLPATTQGAPTSAFAALASLKVLK